MNKYELLQDENQRFWESLDLGNTLLTAQDFATLAEEESGQELETSLEH